MQFCRTFAAVAGGSSPQSRSMITSRVKASFPWRRSRARTERCLAPAPVSAEAMVPLGGPTGGEQAYVIPQSHGVTVQSPAQASAYQLKVEAMRGQARNDAYQLSVDAMRGQALNKTFAGNTPGTSVSKLGPLDAWAIGAISANQPVPTVVTSTRTSDGFNWSDAGIGAAVTFGAVLFLLTAVLLGRKRIDRSGLARA